MTSIAPEAVRGAFESIARALSLAGGFTLMPVDVTGPDLGRALAAWLTERGTATRVIEPLGEEQWRELVATLVTEGEAGSGAVMVLGPRRLAPGMPAGLRLANQRRDTIVAELACPLLWCGPREFLEATWERAPDLWSIRGMTARVELEARAPVESPLWPGVVVRDPAERLRGVLEDARARGDAGHVALASTQLAEVLLAQGEYAEVTEVLEAAKAVATGEAAAWLALLAGRAAIAADDVPRANESLDEAAAIAAREAPHVTAMVTAARGNLASREDPARAKALYEEALAAMRASPGAQPDARNEAVLVADLAIARLALGDAEAALAELEAARATLRDVGDERGEARAVVHVGRAHAALFDARAAAACFEEALAMARDQGDLRGEARVLCHVARAYYDLGDAEKARDDAARALTLAWQCGDARIVARAEATAKRVEA
jgi:tetratricopeptide (TPR) repeat protein